MGRRFLIAFVLWMVFAFGMSQSATIIVGWWNEQTTAGPWEWMWIGLLPVWLFVFFRYYSIFRPGCRACLPPEGKSR